MLQLIALGCPMTQDEPSLAAAADGTREEDQKPVRRIRGVLVFLVVMAVIGVGSGLAWRIFTNYYDCSSRKPKSSRAGQSDGRCAEVEGRRRSVGKVSTRPAPTRRGIASHPGASSSGRSKLTFSDYPSKFRLWMESCANTRQHLRLLPERPPQRQRTKSEVPR